MPIILDEESLKGLVGDDIEGFIPIVNEFDQNGQELISQISKALQIQDLRGVRASAHQLKGSSGMLGMKALYELCKQAETSKLPELELYAEKLTTSHQAAMSAARQILGEM